MKMTIQERAIDNFNIIYEISQHSNIGLGSFIDIHIPIPQIISSFQALSDKRPKLRKLGIYTKISLRNIYVNFSEQSCQQIVDQYIHRLFWNDLQYVALFDVLTHDIYVHIIFNRVTPEGKLITLKCLGATWHQYEILRKSCSHLLDNSSHNEDLQNRFCDCSTKAKAFRRMFYPP